MYSEKTNSHYIFFSHFLFSFVVMICLSLFIRFPEIYKSNTTSFDLVIIFGGNCVNLEKYVNCNTFGGGEITIKIKSYGPVIVKPIGLLWAVGLV